MLDRFHAALDLVEIVAIQMSKSIGSTIDRDDLLACGREGLLEAARRFDPSRNVPFRAYANYRVRGAMLDELRRSASLPRRAYERLLAIQAITDVSKGELDYTEARATLPADVAEAEKVLSEHLSAMAMAAVLAGTGEVQQTATLAPAETESSNPEDALSRAELVRRVRQALEELSPTAAAVVRRHFLEGERLEDIARDYSMSKSWASRLLTRTTACLAKRLQGFV